MPASNISGPFLFRPDSDLVGAPFDGLPLDVISQVGPNGNSGTPYYFNHFLRWEGPVAEGSAGGWTLSGTTGAATIVLGDTREGTIIITADATAGCNPTLALGSATLGKNYIYAVGKRLWCSMRFKVSTVATIELFLGFGTPDTSPTVTGTLPSDGIFFHKARTATKISFQARKDGTGTDKADIGAALVDATYTTLGMYVDTTGNIHAYQDGVELSTGFIAAGTANIPGAGDGMQFIVGFLEPSMTLTPDWLLIAQDI